jgi:hypothetical protein
MLRIALAAATVAFLGASPAQASFSVWCIGPEGVSFEAPLGGGIGLKSMSTTVEAAGKVWTTETSLEDPQAIVPAQEWGGEGFMWFDFSDANFERNVVMVRITWVAEGGMSATIEIPGIGKWDATCDLG